MPGGDEYVFTLLTLQRVTMEGLAFFRGQLFGNCLAQLDGRESQTIITHAAENTSSHKI